jgi:hypothetical protein
MNIQLANIDIKKLRMETERIIDIVINQCLIKGRKLNGPVKIEAHFSELKHVAHDQVIKKSDLSV